MKTEKSILYFSDVLNAVANSMKPKNQDLMCKYWRERDDGRGTELEFCNKTLRTFPNCDNCKDFEEEI